MSEGGLGINTHPGEPSSVANTSVGTAEQSNQPSDPTFQPETIEPAYASPRKNPFGISNVGGVGFGGYASPALGDIDGDGDLDLFIGNVYGNTFYFKNTGFATNPSFAPYKENHFGISDVGGVGFAGHASPALGDIDADGDLDLFIGNLKGNTFYFENTGSATNPSFAPYKENHFGISSMNGYASPALGDIDGDGDLDLFIGSYYGNTFYFENTGSATNPSFASYKENHFGISNVGVVSNSEASPALGDIDGDGDLDLFIGSYLGDTYYFENTGSATNPSFAPYKENHFGISNVGSNASPILGDIDGDGDFDLFIGSDKGDTYFFRNTTPSNSFNITNVGAKAKPAFPLLNGDDDLDLFIGNQNGDIIYFENTAPGGVNPSYTEAVTNPFGIDGAGAFNASPAFVDVDNDGDQDLFLGNSEGDLVFYRNNASPGDQPKDPDYSLEAINPFGIDRVDQDANPAFVDIDRDGDLDLFVGDYAGNINYFLNTASPNQEPSFVFQDVNLFGITNVSGGGAGGGGAASPAFHDIDQDGDLDLFIGNDNGDTFFFRNTASAGATTPAFATPIENPFGMKSTAVGGYAAPVFVDLLGDGTVDLLFGNQDGDIVAFHNKESGILSDSTGDSSVLSIASNGGSQTPVAQIVATTEVANGSSLSNLRELEIALSNKAIDFEIELDDDASTATANIPLAVLEGDLTLTSDDGKRDPSIAPIYYAINNQGDLSPLSFDPLLNAGARFYDTNGDGIADFLSLKLKDGGFGDKDGVKNGVIDDPSTLGTVRLNPILTALESGILQVADATNAAPAALNLNATITGRGEAVNQIGYIVLNPDDVASAETILGDLDQLKERATILLNSLELEDITLAEAFQFSKDLLIRNGQSVRFFTLEDTTLDTFSSLDDSRFSFLKSTANSDGSFSFSSSAGMSFDLALNANDQGLAALIAQEQHVAPLLDFTAFTNNETITGTITQAREADFDAVTGFYRVLDTSGSVRAADGSLLTPGDAGYAAAALLEANRISALGDLSIADGESSSTAFSLQDASYIAPFAQVEGNTFFAFADANTDGLSHFRSLGSNLFGLEDQLGGGDLDYDDHIVGFSIGGLTPATPAVA